MGSQFNFIVEIWELTDFWVDFYKLSSFINYNNHLKLKRVDLFKKECLCERHQGTYLFSNDAGASMTAWKRECCCYTMYKKWWEEERKTEGLKTGKEYKALRIYTTRWLLVIVGLSLFLASLESQKRKYIYTILIEQKG